MAIADVLARATEGFIEVPDGKVWYQSVGTGEPLLFSTAARARLRPTSKRSCLWPTTAIRSSAMTNLAVESPISRMTHPSGPSITS